MVADGESTSAIQFLERAKQIRDAKESSLAKRGEASFALARALWNSKRDRGRARLLADEARTHYFKAAEKLRLAEVQDWLHDHGST